MPPLDPAQRRDVGSLVHPYTELASFRDTGPTILVRGEGIRVFDEAGRSYIEGVAGLWCTALGYGNAELVEAGREQLARLPFAHLFGAKSHDPAVALAEKLKAIAPAPTSKVFFTASGSEANDTQVKLVWYYNNARGLPAKKKIISRLRAYHGVTLGLRASPGCPTTMPISTCRCPASSMPIARIIIAARSRARARRRSPAGSPPISKR